MDNDQSFISPEFKEALNKYSNFFVEAKKRFLFTLFVFIGSTFFGFFFYEQVIKFLVSILSLNGINIVFTSPFQFINLAISCGVTVGLVIAIPLLVGQILSFLHPALKKSEFKTFIWLLPFSLILFVFGFVFGFLIMKWQIAIFLSKSVSIGIGNILDISKLLNVVLLTASLMGLGFQFPIALLLLIRLDLIDQQKLTKQRRWVYLASFIFALVLPPDSILADILLSLPLILLFEFTLILNKILERNKKNREKN